MIFDLVVNLFESVLFIYFLYSLSKTHKQNAVLYSWIAIIANFTIISTINIFSPSESLLFIVFVLIYFL